VAALNCTVEDFDAMTVDGRITWVHELMNTHGVEGNFSDWFNNIVGILKFARERDLMRTGSWESWVDSSILAGINDGLGYQLGLSSASVSPAAVLWREFFIHRDSGDPSDVQSKKLWAIAEQTATDAGVALARSKGINADPRIEAVLITYGDAYRAGVKDESTARYLGRELGWRGGALLGAYGGSLVGFASCSGPCALAGGIGGGILGTTYGWLFGESQSTQWLDPRNEWAAEFFTSALYEDPGFIGTPR